MSTVGFVGLGAMGGRLAGRLLDAGNELYGCNRTRSKAQPLMERGLRWRESPREVAAAADVVFSMVSDDRALDAITSGPNGIIAGLADGKLYIDMSTVSPRASRRLAAEVHSLGARMLDAPVSGSVPQAESGTLAIFVGGSGSGFARAEPLLRELGQAVTHVGANGQGLLVKLAVNISLAAQTLDSREGLLLAERGKSTRESWPRPCAPARSGRRCSRRAPRFCSSFPEQAWFDMALMASDIRLAREAAHELAIPLPLTAVGEEVPAGASDLGYAHRLAALHEVLEESVAA